MQKAAVVVVSASLFAFGCGDSVTGPDDLTGVSWKLQSLQQAGGSVVSPPAGTFTVRFTEEGRLEVAAGCNGCTGTYQLTDGALSVTPLLCTLRACPSSGFDAEYGQLLSAATTAERSDDVLTLRSPAGMLRFVP
jgi:heat shock protein HslJ